MKNEMKEFLRQLKRFGKCQSTPWHARAKLFGRGWMWMNTNLWTYGKEAGLDESEIKRHIESVSAKPITVDQLVAVC